MLSWPHACWWLLVFVSASIAAWTDWRRARIYNWLTLPGMLAGLLGQWGLYGGGGVADSLAGWLAVGGLMVVALALFPHVGGGDVKLMAMLGAMLGLEAGLETLLWTCAVAVLQVLAILTWKAGIWNACRAVWLALSRSGRPVSSGDGSGAAIASESSARLEAERSPAEDPLRDLLNDRMRMAPAAWVAVVIVLAQRAQGTVWLSPG